MKRISILILAAFFSVFGVLTAYAAENEVEVVLDGQRVDCEKYGQPAVIVEDRTMVPLRAIFEALGASVEWDEKTYTVTSVLGETSISLTVGSNELLKNGETILLDVPARIMNERTVVPVRAVSEAFGIKVRWNETAGTVFLSTDPYEPGVVCGSTYHDAWAGFNYTLPDGSEFYEEAELLSLTENDSGADAVLSDYALLPAFYSFGVRDEKGNSLVMVCERNPENLTSEKYAEAVSGVYSEYAGISDVYESDVCGIPVKAVDVDVKYMGINVYQRLMVFEKDSRLVSFVLTVTDKDDLDKLLSGFSYYTVPDCTENAGDEENADAVPTFNPSDIPVADEDEDSDDEYIRPSAVKVHAYDELYLGMTKDEVLSLVSGKIKLHSRVVDVWDYESEYDDEDEEIFGPHVNCDYISLGFEDGLLSSVYVTTEYLTADDAVEVLGNVIDHYGENYTVDMENNGYIWINYEGTNVCTGFVYEREYKRYYCYLVVNYSE